jgi:hypothetical protein
MSIEPPPPPAAPRHGCLLAYLIVFLIINSLAVVANIAMAGAISTTLPNAPAWAAYALALAGLINVGLCIALFKWQLWAFYAFCVMAAVIFVFNLYIGVPVPSCVGGLIGPAVLYGVLQIGGANKGWNNSARLRLSPSSGRAGGRISSFRQRQRAVILAGWPSTLPSLA